MRTYWLNIAILMLLSCPAWAAAEMAKVVAVRQPQCEASLPHCENFDAIVFVHGIYGDKDTFRNPSSQFYWPEEIPAQIAGRSVDVFVASYQTQLLNWAKSKDPGFGSVSDDFYTAMTPLRERRYRSIGFIAHSLGGNIVSTYIHQTKSKKGHIARARNAYVITLGTPITGAFVADIGSVLKSLLGMDDKLLDSLKEGNLYLDMLARFRKDEDAKALGFLCRPVYVHAAFETRSLAGIKIVPPTSALGLYPQLFNTIPVPLDANHSTIAKPVDRQDAAYVWVDENLKLEFDRLKQWQLAQGQLPVSKQICNAPEGVD